MLKIQSVAGPQNSTLQTRIYTLGLYLKYLRFLNHTGNFYGLFIMTMLQVKIKFRLKFFNLG